jgi:hypothetical protein
VAAGARFSQLITTPCLLLKESVRHHHFSRHSSVWIIQFLSHLYKHVECELRLYLLKYFIIFIILSASAEGDWDNYFCLKTCDRSNKMTLRITRFLNGVHHPFIENTTFQKLDQFPSSDVSGNTYSVGSLRKSFRNVVLSITGRWTQSKNLVILSVTHHRQNPSESSMKRRLLTFREFRISLLTSLQRFCTFVIYFLQIINYTSSKNLSSWTQVLHPGPTEDTIYWVMWPQ